MSQKQETELHKEFELERLILFSDAVFAIAITLLIIEVKFPEIEKDADTAEIWKEFKPILIQFGSVVLSFIFIGTMWIKHLQLFRYLHKYDKKLLVRNLFFLFFVICFPFSASGLTEHIRPGFTLPLSIYMCNIAGVTTAQYFLTKYVFQDNKHLTVPGSEAEKKYMLISSKWFAIAFIVAAFFYIMVPIFLSTYIWAANLPTVILIIMVTIMRRKTKKYKPAGMDEQAVL